MLGLKLTQECPFMCDHFQRWAQDILYLYEAKVSFRWVQVLHCQLSGCSEKLLDLRWDHCFKQHFNTNLLLSITENISVSTVQKHFTEKMTMLKLMVTTMLQAGKACTLHVKCASGNIKGISSAPTFQMKSSMANLHCKYTC